MGKYLLADFLPVSLPGLQTASTISGSKIAQFCEKNAGNEIGDYVLLYCQRRNADRNRDCKRGILIPFRDMSVLSGPDPAEPAEKAMD